MRSDIGNVPPPLVAFSLENAAMTSGANMPLARTAIAAVERHAAGVRHKWKWSDCLMLMIPHGIIIANAPTSPSNGRNAVRSRVRHQRHAAKSG